MVRRLFGIATTMVVALSTANAQRPKRVDQPAGQPSAPAQMCRIWLDGVRPDSQPAPTDCATALRNRPPNARVIFGKDADKRSQPPRAPVDTTRPVDDRKGRRDKPKKPE